MNHLTLFASTCGGLLIGLAAALLLLFDGQLAGISSILGGLVRPRMGNIGWRACFLGGLLVGGLVLGLVHPGFFVRATSAPTGTLVAAGLLVGFGTRLGNGCTSGHGVCGLSRVSPRSLGATLTFMATGALTVFVVRHLLGGAR